MQVARKNHAWDFVRKKRLIALETLIRAERFEIKRLGVANGLHTLKREIARESRQHQAGPIDRGLFDRPFQAARSRHQIQFEIAGVIGVKALYRDDVALHVYMLNSGPR